jgi:hypothetical protein
VGGSVILGDAKPPGLDILCGVDRLATCKTKSYMEKLTFTRACLSNVILIIVIMQVPLVESLCQAVMGRIPVVEYLLPDAHVTYGHILSCQTINATASRDLGSW